MSLFSRIAHRKLDDGSTSFPDGTSIKIPIYAFNLDLWRIAIADPSIGSTPAQRITWVEDKYRLEPNDNTLQFLVNSYQTAVVKGNEVLFLDAIRVTLTAAEGAWRYPDDVENVGTEQNFKNFLTRVANK